MKLRFAVALIILLLGTLLEIASPAQTLDTLLSFNLTNGEFPTASPVQGANGNFYGTTSGGGANGDGTVFEITPAGKLTTLYNFCALSGCVDGADVFAGLTLATDGYFYGVTAGGGDGANCVYGGCGTVFKISPKRRLTSLYRFCLQSGCPDGNTPIGLVQATNGNLYGVTYYGGANGDSGTIFELTRDGKLTTLYSFCAQSGCIDGKYPDAGLIQGRDGKLYGTTSYGGNSNEGTVFQITLSGKLTTLYSFCVQTGCADGAQPEAGLVQAADANFYGTTSFGGVSGYGGTVLTITRTGKLTTLYSFCSQEPPYCTDGRFPLGALVQAADANFYGTTNGGGANAEGTIFKVSPNGQLSTLYSFCTEQDCIDGRLTYGGLLHGTDGKFYGTAYQGGADSDGTVFSLAAGLGPFVEMLPTSGTVGTNVTIFGNELSGTTRVAFDGTTADFKVVSNTEITTSVPLGASTGPLTVTAPNKKLKSNVVFRVVQ